MPCKIQIEAAGRRAREDINLEDQADAPSDGKVIA